MPKTSNIFSFVKKIQRQIQRLIGKGSVDRNFIASQAAGMYVLRVTYKVINFVMAIFLARWLGQTVFGEYSLAFSWAALLMIPAGLGLSRLVSRDITKAYVQKHWGIVKGIFFWSFFMSVASSILVGAAMVLVSSWVYKDDPAMRTIFIAASLLIPTFVLVQHFQATLTGFKKITEGRVPDSVIQPLVFLACIGLLHWLAPEWLTAATVLIIYALTTFLFSLGIGAWQLRRAFPPEAIQAKSERAVSDWLRNTFTFLLISTMFAADSRSSTLLLGGLAQKSDVANYSVLTRVVDLLTFFVVAFGGPVSRIGIKYYYENNLIKLQRLMTRTTRVMVLLGWPLAILIILTGTWYLRLFGDEYLPGYPALILLTVAEMVNLATGNAAYLLSMTDHIKVTARVIFAALTLNIILGFILIPKFGLMGGAIAEASSVIFRNLVIAYSTYKIIGVNTTILAQMPRRQKNEVE